MKKRNVTLYVPEDIANEFDRVASEIGHAKQKGLIFTAALVAFLRMDPRDQGSLVEEMAAAEIKGNTKNRVDAIRMEQAKNVLRRDELEAREPPRATG